MFNHSGCLKVANFDSIAGWMLFYPIKNGIIVRTTLSWSSGGLGHHLVRRVCFFISGCLPCRGFSKYLRTLTVYFVLLLRKKKSEPPRVRDGDDDDAKR